MTLASDQTSIGPSVCVGVVDVEILSSHLFGAVEPEAGKAPSLNARRLVGIAGGVFQCEAGVDSAGSSTAPVLDACGEDVLDDRLSCGQVQYGNGIVLLQRDPGGVAVGADGNGLGLHILGDVGGHAQALADAHAPVDQLGSAVLPSSKTHRLHIRLRRRRRCGSQEPTGVDHRDRSLGINGVRRIGLAFVGDQQLAAIAAEFHHVGQGTHRESADRHRQCRISDVEEFNKAWVGLDRVLNSDCQQVAEHCSALQRLKGGAGAGIEVGVALGDHLWLGGIAEISYHDGAGAATNGVEVAVER